MVEGTRRHRRGAGDPRRSRAECDQGAEAARRRQSAENGERRKRPEATGSEPGYIGVDRACAARYTPITRRCALADFVMRREREGHALHRHELGPGRSEPDAADIRNVVEGDPSPTGKGHLKIARGIEVGHIFQLGQKYSTPMKATVLDEAGQGRDALHGLLWHWCDAHRCRRD